MDYRRRKYYLVRFYNYNQSIYEIKNKIKSVKIHEPYNHFRNDKAKLIMKMKSKLIADPSVYDGDANIKTTYVQAMISCNIEDSSILESIIKEEIKMLSTLSYFTYFIELTQEILGQ